MPTDLGIRRAAQVLGLPDDPVQLAIVSEEWRPWRSYAVVHMWAMPEAQQPMAKTPTVAAENQSPKKRSTKRSLRGRDAA
jgi:3-methyladenine DNA glycosylase/8-oxoguanine DNA glycosylase